MQEEKKKRFVPSHIEAVRATGRGRIRIVEILLFLAVFFATTSAQGMVQGIIILCMVLPKALMGTGYSEAELTHLADSSPMMLVSLFCTVVTTILVIIFCRFIQRRKLYTMGFIKKRWLWEYAKGLFFGAAMFTAVVLILHFTGNVQLVAVRGVNWWMILLFFLGFVVQGMSEEVLCRGYFMTSLARKSNLFIAVFYSSAMFSLLHIFNPGFDWLSGINITLAGVVFGLYMLCTDNIWGACAMHSVWNFVQGNVFGFSVSGLARTDSLMQAYTTNVNPLLAGGAFGPEGGLATTIVLSFCTIVLLLWYRLNAKENQL